MAGPIADLKVQMELESAKFRAELERTTEKIARVEKQIAGMGDGFKKMSASVFKGVAAWAMASGAAQRLGDFLMNGVRGLAEQEQASFRLAGALKQLGYDANGLMRPMTQLADELERTTLFQAEQVLQVEELLLRYGVAPKNIEKTTRALLDYASMTGKGAAPATETLMTALQGSGKELRAFGLAVQKTGDRTEDLNRFVEKMAEQFGGSAQAAAGGLAGEMDRLAKAQDELAKSFAQLFAGIDRRIGVFSTLTKAVKGLKLALLGDEEAEQHAKLVDEFEAAGKEVVRLNEELRKAERLLDEIVGGKELGRAFRNVSEEGQILARVMDLTAQLDRAEARLQAARDRLGDSTATRDGKGLTGDASGKAGKGGGGSDDRVMKVSLSAAREVDDRVLSRVVESMGGGIHGVFRQTLSRMVQEWTAAFQTPMEIFLAERQRLNQLLEAGLSQDVYNRALAEAEFRLKSATTTLDGFAATLSASLGGRLGAVGNLVGGAQQGAASGMMAGPKGAAVGAAVGAGLELLMQSESFQRAVKMANTVIQKLADIFGSFLEPMTPLIAVTGLVVDGIGKMLQPSLDLLAGVIESLTPAFLVVATVFEQLAPMLGGLLQGLLVLVTNGVLLLIPAAMSSFFEVVKFVGLGILKTVEFVSDWWNDAVNAIRRFIDWLANITIDVAGFTIKPFAALSSVADAIGKTAINQEELARTIEDLEGLTFDLALEKAKELTATENMTEAMDKATQSVLGLPAFYKVNSSRWAAMQPSGSAQAAMGGGDSFTSNKDGLSTGDINVTIVSNDPETIWSKLEPFLRAREFRRAGRPTIRLAE